MQYQVLWLWLQNKSPVSSLLNISSTNYYYRAFAGDVVVKNQPVNAGDAGDLGSIFGLGRSPGIGNGNPIQYSCLDNSMDRGTWWVTVHGVAKSMTWLSTHTHTHTHTNIIIIQSITLNEFSSVTQLCLTLCDPMDCSTPGFPVHHQLLELTQTHVHWLSDAIQPSHSLSSPSPPAFDLSQHQGLFKWASSSHQVAKVLEFQLQHQSFQWIFRTDLL